MTEFSSRAEWVAHCRTQRAERTAPRNSQPTKPASVRPGANKVWAKVVSTKGHTVTTADLINGDVDMSA
jgi:hypothetical protein